ncbi:MAG: Transposase [Polyangiaceae bacterium]|nr:Transposase [Polyangiaceae bacterium]
MEFSRQRLGEGAKRGDLTGPNPTDRAKSGVKRHILTDGRGVPIAALISGANVPDAAMISEVLDAVVMRGPRGPRRPEHLCLDKGYDYPHVAPAIRLRGIRPHIRRRGEQPLIGKVRGKARRWVVERTNSWHNRFRGLLVRWERRGAHYLALLQLGAPRRALPGAAPIRVWLDRVSAGNMSFRIGSKYETTLTRRRSRPLTLAIDMGPLFGDEVTCHHVHGAGVANRAKLGWGERNLHRLVLR